MAKYYWFGCRNLSLRRTSIKAIKSLALSVCFLLLIVVALFKVLEIVLDTKSYPYNMYRGYPLSIYSNPYHINLNSTCADNSKINMIIVVHSEVTNFKKREQIRSTWGNRHFLNAYRIKLLFFLGMPFYDDIQILVNKEASENSDIVQGSFLDSYTNVTHKAVLWLRWVSEYCPMARYVLKIDDDVFVNVFSLYHTFIPTYRNASNTIWCETKPAGTLPISRANWRVANHELEGHVYYPLQLCRGYFVILSRDSIRLLYEAAKVTPFFWNDDYYVFGILANITDTLHTQIVSDLSDQNNGFECFESKKHTCSLFGILLKDRKAMEILWELSLLNFNKNQV